MRRRNIAERFLRLASRIRSRPPSFFPGAPAGRSWHRATGRVTFRHQGQGGVVGIPCPFRALCGSKPRPSEYAKVERSGVGVLTAGSCCGGVRPFAGATRAANGASGRLFFFLFARGTVRQCDVTAPSRGAFFKSSGVTTHRSLRFACLRRSCKETKAPLKTRGGTGKVTGRKTSRVFGEGWEGKRREGGRSVGWWTTARQKRSCRGRFNSCRRGSFCQGGSRKQVSLGRVSDFASSHYPPVLCPPH